MTDTQAEATASLNGTVPAPAAAEDCADCASGGEKAMAILAGAFALFLLAMAYDMYSGGKVSGYVRERTVAQ
jgi:hypothetical protein